MANKNIQMKKREGNSWDNLFPVSLDENIYDNTGKSLETYKQEKENELNSRFDDVDQAFNDTNDNIEMLKKTVIHVEDYPKLSSDDSDSERINRIFKEVVTDGSTIVFETGKTYVFHEPVEIDNIRITLLGNNSTIKINGNYSAFNSFTVTRTNYYNQSLTSVIIDGFNFVGENLTGYGISITGFTRGCEIKNCKFDNLETGIRLTGSWSFRIDTCYFNNSIRGVLLGSSVIGDHKGSTNVNAVTIANSVFTEIRDSSSLTGFAIFSYESRNFLALGNTIELCDNGITVLKGHSIRIIANYLEYVRGPYGVIQLGGADTGEEVKSWTVSDNSIFMCYLVFNKASNGEYRNNDISGAINRAIRIPSGYTQFVKNNYFMNDGNYLFSNESDFALLDNNYNSYIITNNYEKRPVALGDGWSNDSRKTATVRYDSAGYVHFEGSVNRSEGAGTLTTLNLVYRPLDFYAGAGFLDDGTPVTMNISSSSGNVTVSDYGTGRLNFNLTFKPQIH